MRVTSKLFKPADYITIGNIKALCQVNLETGCWNWTKATNRVGIPIIRFEYKEESGQWRNSDRSIRQIVFSLATGEQAAGALTTKCGTLNCVNPQHIIPIRGNVVFQPKHQVEQKNKLNQPTQDMWDLAALELIEKQKAVEQQAEQQVERIKQLEKIKSQELNGQEEAIQKLGYFSK